jgi:hypothetical protein
VQSITRAPRSSQAQHDVVTSAKKGSHDNPRCHRLDVRFLVLGAAAHLTGQVIGVNGGAVLCGYPTVDELLATTRAVRRGSVCADAQMVLLILL